MLIGKYTNDHCRSENQNKPEGCDLLNECTFQSEARQCVLDLFCTVCAESWFTVNSAPHKLNTNEFGLI